MPYFGGQPQQTTPQFLMERLMKGGLSREQAAALVGMARQGMVDKQNFQRAQMAQKSQENTLNRQQRAQEFDMAQKQRAAQQRLNPRGNP